MKRLLVIDRDASFREELARAAHRAGYLARTATTSAHVLAAPAPERFDAVLLEVADPSDVERVTSLRRWSGDAPLLAMGVAPEVERVVAALRAGARDFLRKPFGIERLLQSLGAAAPARDADAGEFVTAEPAVLRLLESVRRASEAEATLQIVGESGTGKELLARLAHRASPRRNGPFVTVACAGLHRTLAESELFGHERGAFTGAIAARGGQIAAAHGGTLVLDEVADLDRELQPKLLRVLQERELVPLGGLRPVAVDVRVIATTQRDLAAEVAAGRFREDLYYRLDVITLRIPPLRERPADLPLLARRLLERLAARAGSACPQLGDGALEALARLRLRGNVRELANLMRRAALLFPGQEVEVERLLRPGAPTEPMDRGLGTLNLRELERAAIARCLAECGGNRTHASRKLGISVRTLRNKIRLYDLA